MEGNYQRLPIAIVYQEKAAFKDTYAGAENTDYTNLLNYNRQITTRGSILAYSNNLYDLNKNCR